MEDKTPADSREPFEPTTTHAEWGAGNPRLLVSSEADRFEFPLTGDSLWIGSAGNCDLVLAGTDGHHATVIHDERDEYVLTLHGDGEMNADPLSAATHEGERSETLRTGARFTAGGWTLVFMRDEYADHGRPFGGREGGEGEHQRPQPPRPDYASDGHDDAAPGHDDPAEGREVPA